VITDTHAQSGTRVLRPEADPPVFQDSIESQRRCKFRVIHAREIIPGVHVSCSVKEELVEGLESARAQRMNNAAEGDLYEKLIRARNGYELEVPWEYPRPIGNEVVLRERCSGPAITISG
jgi:hypothetical protein